MTKVTQIGLVLQIMLNFGVAYRDAGYPYSECTLLKIVKLSELNNNANKKR